MKDGEKSIRMFQVGKWLFIVLILKLFVFSEETWGVEQELRLAVQYDIDKVRLINDVKYKNKEHDFFLNHYDIGIRFPLRYMGRDSSLGIHYRSIFPEKNDSSDGEKRLYFQFQKKFTLPVVSENFSTLRGKFRVRQEFRVRKNKKNAFRSRIRVNIKHHRKILGSTPFLANEYYFDLNKNKVSKVRLDVGVELFKLNDVKANLYYKLMLNNKNEKWLSSQAFVLKLMF